jgi:hypothetical protein
MQPLGEVCVLFLSLSLPCFSSHLFFLGNTCFRSHVSLHIELCCLYYGLSFSYVYWNGIQIEWLYEITSILPHGIHNVASFSAKSWFRFASPGWSTRLSTLFPALRPLTSFRSSSVPSFEWRHYFSEARGKIVPKF